MMFLILYYLDGLENFKFFNDCFFVYGIIDFYYVSRRNGGGVFDDVVDNVDKFFNDVFGLYKDEFVKDFNKGFDNLMMVDDYSICEFLR